VDTVFITHSKYDSPILQHIDWLVRSVNVEPIFYRYNNMINTTAWEEIRNSIRNCSALFVVLSNNLSSSPHTQNWVGWEVGVACAFNKRVWVFEELNRRASFPIPYVTDYVPYDINDHQLRSLVSSVAKAYCMQSQRTAMIGLGGIGALLFGPPGLIGGAVLGVLANQPQAPPYIELLCYHLDCKLRFKSYVWLEEMECPACRRKLRFRTETLDDGNSIVLPNPYRWELTYTNYVWFDQTGNLQLYELT
jgi:hypothetical protein